MAVKRVIALSGTHGPEGMPLVIDDAEFVAGEAFKPGHLLEITSTGTVVKQTDDAANVAARFALERDELGKDIDVAYASGDQVKYGEFSPGQRVLAWVASGQTISKGDYLTSDTSGGLSKANVAAGVRLAQALEAVTAVADTRIRVRIV